MAMDSNQIVGKMLRSFKSFPIDLVRVYPGSFCSLKELTYGLIRIRSGKKLAVMGEKSSVLDDPFQGDCYHHGSTLKLCDLSRENTECLMALFPYTRPSSLCNFPITIGIEDLLGVATPGYIRAIRRFQARPVFARGSVCGNREEKGDFTEAVRNSAWAVFQENDREGYGVNGDPLKSLEQVNTALDADVSMITLDLSGQINSDTFHLTKASIDRKFKEEIDEDDAKVMLHLFLDKEFLYARRAPSNHENFSLGRSGDLLLPG